ncbi:hypothetical protein B0J11DRAFT_431328 [Dendryphion nanum]|uniref:DUF7082 domain-containing protein n=1 Tax=Dendryphion nanum TaxID=256645 RepID=A0A9P9E0T5_9PLEO|nr:hypothetical protein B0J11DRAFT_431328 [Dendryphion nanum]
MSGYGKGQEHYVYDTAATRPNQAANYPGLAQPSFAPQYSDVPARLSHEPSTVDVPYISSSTYESRGATSYQSSPAFIDARSRHPATHPASEPEVTNVVQPCEGTAGSSLFLHIRTRFDLENEGFKLAFMFESKRCAAVVQKVEHIDDFYNYALHVEVPPFASTNTLNPTMMLKLRVEDANDQLIHELEAGKFTFTDMSPNLTYGSMQSSPALDKKRKYSTTDFGETQDGSENAKRANTMRVHAKPRSSSLAYSTASASPLPIQSSLSNAYGYSNAYDMGKQMNYTPQLPQKALYAVPSGMNMQQTDMKPPAMSPNLSSYSQYSSMSQTRRSPSALPTPHTPSRASVMPSPTAPAPLLVRATTISQAGGGPTSQPFNPYSMLTPSKAQLKIDGDLDKMSQDWTDEEIESKRRLVQFERSQSGSTITTTFAPITPEERPSRSICVSCILWEEKGECYITSVDTIYLLEQLVAVRFTVEEKNRIRRNLEGFRPLTVSKAKTDSEEFFKVIMGFPNPKPRNIEKDVKIFKWSCLSHALRKIISKYTASYSSTAAVGSLPAAGPAAYVPVGISHMGDVHRNTSPRSAMTSTASYPPSMTSSGSPGLRGSSGLGASAAQGTMTQWGSGAHPQVSQYTGLPAARGSWEYGPYMDPSGAAQSMHDNPPAYQQYSRV